MLLANTITAEMGLIPGLAMLGPAMGLPLSVLAAFIERPFYSLAGVTRQTIWYSLQANLISLVIGWVLVFVVAGITDALRQTYAIFEVWPFLAVAISIVIERSYLNVKVRERNVAWGWSILGNALSAGLCVGLLFYITYAKDSPAYASLRYALTPITPWLHLFAFISSAALFAYSFRRTRRPVADESISGPAV